MTLEAVIFDWAGTTVDYGCFAPVRAFQECFRLMELEPTMDEVRAPMGMLKRDHIRTMLDMPRLQALFNERHGRAPETTDIDRMYAAFEGNLFSILGEYCTPKPHVLETVTQLRARGLKIGSTTGYTDSMMEVVRPKAAALGYAPDFLITPDGVGGKGRPYPYMVFRNLEALGVSSVRAAVKVGDTVSDIQEGVNAGVWTIGVTEGSSALSLSEQEYAALSPDARASKNAKVRETFLSHGAHTVITNLAELPAALARLENAHE